MIAKVLAGYRLIGLAAAALVGVLFEMRVGFSPFGIDPRLDLLLVPFVWLIILVAAEWFGEEELKKRGVQTSGMTSRKQY